MSRGERARRPAGGPRAVGGAAAGFGSPSAGGFTYVGLLALLVLIGLMLAAAGEVAATAAQRERETQLLWVGHEYRAAIGRYWSQKRAYPQSLRDLLGAASDAPVQVRYLRSLYPDPMTNAVDWVLVPAPNGGIMGVASSSKRAPLKTGHFDEADRDFASASSYGDWQFTFLPRLGRRKTP
jgi:type II secretory pathway pseudopilin PulG